MNDDLGVIATASESPVPVDGHEFLNTPAPSGPATSFGLDHAQALPTPMLASGSGEYIPAARLPETPARQGPFIYDLFDQVNGIEVLPLPAARQTGGRSMEYAPSDYDASGGARVGAAAAVSSREGLQPLPVLNVQPRSHADDGQRAALLAASGYDRLTNNYEDQSAQVRNMPTAPRAQVEAGRPSMIVISGEALRDVRGSNPERLGVRPDADPADVRMLRELGAGVLQRDDAYYDQRLGRDVVYYHDQPRGAQDTYDVHPERSRSPPQARSSAAPVLARQPRYPTAIEKLKLESAVLKEAAVTRLTTRVHELLQGFRPGPRDPLESTDAKLRAVAMRLPTVTGGEVYAALLRLAVGLPNGPADHDPVAQSAMRRKVVDALNELDLDDDQRLVIQQLPEDDVARRQTLYLATNLLRLDPRLQTIDDAARQLFVKHASDALLQRVGTHSSYLETIASLRTEAGDSSQRRFYEAVHALIEKRPLPTGLGPATAGVQRTGMVSLRRLVSLIISDTTCRLIEDTQHLRPIHLALRSVREGLPTAAQPSGSAPQVLHQLHLVLSRASMKRTITIDELQASLNELIADHAGVADADMLLREADVKSTSAPAVASAYVAAAVPEPAEAPRPRAEKKVFVPPEQRARTLRTVGAAIQAELQRPRSPVRQDEHRDRHRQHGQRAEQGQRSRSRGRPAQLAEQLPRRDALPSPRRQEQRWQEPRQQQQCQQQQQICYKYNTPEGCTFPNCRYQHVDDVREPAAPPPSQRGGAKGHRNGSRSRQIVHEQVSFIGAFNDHVRAEPIQLAPLQTAATLRVLNEELLCTMVDEEQNEQRLERLRGEEAPYADAVEALAVQSVQQQQEHDDFGFALQLQLALGNEDVKLVVDTAAARCIGDKRLADDIGAETTPSDVKVIGITPIIVPADYKVVVSLVAENESTGRLVKFPPLEIHAIDHMEGKIIISVYQLSMAGCSLHVGKHPAPSFIFLPKDANGHVESVLCHFDKGILVIAASVRVMAPGSDCGASTLSSVPVTSIAPQASMVTRPRVKGKVDLSNNIYMLLSPDEPPKPSKAVKRRRAAANRAAAAAAAAAAEDDAAAPAPAVQPCERIVDVVLQTCSMSKRQRRAGAAARVLAETPAPMPAPTERKPVLQPKYTFCCPPADCIIVEKMATAGSNAECVACDDRRVFREPELRRCGMSFQTGRCPNHIHATCVENGCRIVDGEYICASCVSRCVRYVLETCAPTAEQMADAAAEHSTTDSGVESVMPTEVFIVAEQPDQVFPVGVSGSPFATSLEQDAPQPLQIGCNGEEVLLHLIAAAPVFDLHTLAQLARVCQSVYTKLCRDQGSKTCYLARTCWSRTPLYQPHISQMSGYWGDGVRGLPPRHPSLFNEPLTVLEALKKMHCDANFGCTALGIHRQTPPDFYYPDWAYEAAVLDCEREDAEFIKATYSPRSSKDTDSQSSDDEVGDLPELYDPTEVYPVRNSVGAIVEFAKRPGPMSPARVRLRSPQPLHTTPATAILPPMTSRVFQASSTPPTTRTTQNLRGRRRCSSLPKAFSKAYFQSSIRLRCST